MTNRKRKFLKRCVYLFLILVFAITAAVIVSWLLLPPYNKNFRLANSDADGQGQAIITPQKWYIGSSNNSLTIDFTVGKEGISQGGGIKVTFGHILQYAGKKHLYIPFSLTTACAFAFGINLLQNVAIRTDSSAKLALHTPSPLSSMLTLMRYVKYKNSNSGQQARDNLLAAIDKQFVVTIEVTAGKLAAGEKIRIHLGSSNNLSAPTRENMFEVVLMTDGDGNGSYNAITVCPRLHIIAAKFHRLKIIASSTPKPDTSFNFLVKAEDDFFLPNLVPEYNGTIHFQQQQHMELPKTYTFCKSDGGVKHFRATIRRRGIFRIKLTDNSGNSYSSNPIDTRLRRPVFFGDIHVHSVVSYDADREPQYVFYRQRYIDGHDFTCLTDHDLIAVPPFVDRKYLKGRSKEEWQYLQELTRQHHDPGKFVTLVGYEWTSYNKGHRNIYFAPTESTPPFIPHYHSDSDTPAKLMHKLRNTNAIVIPHSSAWETSELHFDWGPQSWQQQRLVEIYSTHGSSEYFNNPYAVHKGHAEVPTDSQIIKKLLHYDIRQASQNSGNFVRDALASGRKMGFVGCSDMHYLAYINQAYRPGLTACFAKSLTRKEIYAALYRREVYATTGARILIAFTINDCPMGSEITTGNTLNIRGEIIGTDIVTRVELVSYSQGQYRTIHQAHPRRLQYQIKTDIPAPETAFYYLRIVQQDRNMAWSSPIWVTKE